MATHISWLRLELHHLGEIAGDERVEIEHHLTSCEACREAAGSLATDTRTLPKLPRRRRYRPVALSAVALAAALLIFVMRREPHERMKGSDVVLTVMGESAGRIEGAYREGEPLKALVTCPPGLSATFELVVHSRGVRSSPLEPQTIACGNSVPLRGAFQITGEARVCLRWAASAQSEERCVDLAPEAR